MKRLDPKLDLVFKLLLTRAPILLRDMLSNILRCPIDEVEILNPRVSGMQVTDKSIVLDIRARLADGRRIDIEMQMRTTAALTSRLVYYGARDYADQLNRGDSYHLLTPTIVIVWLVDPLFEALDRLHSVFELRERHTHTLFGDQLAFHVLQLSALSETASMGYARGVERWARFLVAHDDDDFDRLTAHDPIMSTARQTLESLSLDPATHRLVREREDAIKLHQLDILACQIEAEAKGRAEGRAKGQAEGRGELLLELLALRFGHPSLRIRTLVGTAGTGQLVQWANRVLTARTIDEVFAA